MIYLDPMKTVIPFFKTLDWKTTVPFKGRDLYSLLYSTEVWSVILVHSE